MESLFGTSSAKGDLVIQSAKTQINRVLEKQIGFNNYELTLLNKSKDELELELIEFNKRGVTDLPSVEIRKYTEPPYHVNDNDTSDTSLFQEANVIYQSDRMIN